LWTLAPLVIANRLFRLSTATQLPAIRMKFIMMFYRALSVSLLSLAIAACTAPHFRSEIDGCLDFAVTVNNKYERDTAELRKYYPDVAQSQITYSLLNTNTST